MVKLVMIIRDLKEVKSFIDRLLGLLRPSNPRSLLFKTRFGTHTFFLKASIDILVLDSTFRVVKLRKSIPSNRLFFWNPKYDTIIELPAGSIRKSDIKLGDKIEIK